MMDGGKTAQADREGSERLAQQYSHRVGFFARKVARMYLLGGRWEDELVSAGYWGLAKALENRRPDASSCELSAYVSQRIVGAVIDEARSCLSRAQNEEVPTVTDRSDDLEAWEDPAPSPEQAVSDRAVRRQVEEVLSHLDAGQRLMLLAYMDGVSIHEMADREGVAVGTMRTRFEKAARLVRGRAPHIRRVLQEAA
jgi:RNA polymerase sigma factor (sigma-70 family)